MATSNLNNELWSTVILKGAQEKMRFINVVDNTGTVEGTTMHYGKIGDITVGDYTKDSNISIQNLSDTGIDIDMNQQKYFAASVEDIDRVQSSSELMSEVVRKGTTGLVKEIDSYVSGLYGSADIVTNLGTTAAPIEINSSNVLTYLRLVARYLKEADADEDTMWMVIPVWLETKLLTALPSFRDGNQQIVDNGYVGSFAGLKLYTSNNVSHSSTDWYAVMAGDKDCIKMGMTIDPSTVQTYIHPNRFAEVVRGLTVYGASVTQSETLACLTCTEIADA